MEPFRTILPREEFPFKIAYTDSIFLTGSCFAEHIFAKLNRGKFSALSNPFGIIYNPASFLNCIQRIVYEKYVTGEDLFFRDELFGHWDFHGSFSGPDRLACIEYMNHSIREARAFISRPMLMFVSLGTAFAYRLQPENRIVSNCHKFPSAYFEKILLSVPQITDILGSIIDEVKSLNPGCRILFTLSPVRHIRDGLIQNQKSKAHLLASIHSVVESHENTWYFPSYELIMDDLRDYRFYARDLCHISEEGIDYVWEYFKNSFFGPETFSILKRVETVQRALEHRPLHPGREMEKKFYQRLVDDMENLEKECPQLSFQEEKTKIT